MRRTAVISGSVIAALAAGGVLAVSGGAQAPGAQTLKYVTKNCQFKFTDVAPKSRGRDPLPGPGDGFFISCRAFNEAGARVGTLDAKCGFTKGGKASRGVCEGVYDLPDGNIFLAALFVGDGDAAGAVVGGDGVYAGAHGTFVSVDRPGEAGGDPSDDTLTLLP